MSRVSEPEIIRKRAGRIYVDWKKFNALAASNSNWENHEGYKEYRGIVYQLVKECVLSEKREGNYCVIGWNWPTWYMPRLSAFNEPFHDFYFTREGDATRYASVVCHPSNDEDIGKEELVSVVRLGHSHTHKIPQGDTYFIPCSSPLSS